MTKARRRGNARRARAAWLALAAVALEPALAQDASNSAAARAFSIVPSVSLQQTLTDNAGLSSTGKRFEAITEATAAVRVESRAGRVRGFLDYALTSRLSTRASDASDLRHTLNAGIAAELIENTAFVDLRGSISQQAISAFGKQSFDPGLDNSNQTQVASFGISPYVRGRLGSIAGYEVRLDHSQTRSGSAAASDSTATSASARLSGTTPAQSVTWSLDASRQVSDFSDGLTYMSDRVRGVLTYAVNPELSISAIGGRESNDFESTSKTTYTNSGAQLRWVPNQRTSLSALVERRFFGNAHAINFSWRTPRTTWTFSDTRDAATTPERLALVRVGTEYDKYFVEFASIPGYADPVLRDVLVRDFLRVNGRNPNTPIFGSLLASGATLQRLQSASVALNGIRSTLTFRTQFGNSQRVTRFGAVNAILDQATRVRQRSFFVDLTHRLTPLSSASLALGTQRNAGSLDEQGSTLTSLSASYTKTLTPRVGLSAGARVVHFSNAVQPYDERAVFGNIRVTF